MGKKLQEVNVTLLVLVVSHENQILEKANCGNQLFSGPIFVQKGFEFAGGGIIPQIVFE